MAKDCYWAISTAQISNGSLNVKCSSARAFPWAWSWACGPSSDLRALPARRSPVAAPHDRASAVARQRKAALRASSHARRSIEGCTKGPERAFLWISKTVSFGKTKEMVFGGYVSKAPAFDLWTLFVRTKRDSPPGETWPCPCCLLLPLRGPPALVLLISLDDPLDNDVSHHVRLSQAADGDVLHPFEHPHGFL